MFKQWVFVLMFVNLKFGFGFRCYTCFDKEMTDDLLKELKDNSGYMLTGKGQDYPLCQDRYGMKEDCHGHCVKQVKDGELHRRYCHKDKITFSTCEDGEDGMKTCNCDRDLCNGSNTIKSGLITFVILLYFVNKSVFSQK